MPSSKNKVADRPQLAKKVQWIRTQAGWNQTQAAEAVGVKRETFNRWETGKLEVPPAKLHKLKHLAHVSLADYKPPLVYDDDGFPAPFSKKKHDELQKLDINGLDTAGEFDAYIDRMIDVEGEDFIEREIDRARIFEMFFYANYLQVPYPHTKAAQRKIWLSESADFIQYVQDRLRNKG